MSFEYLKLIPQGEHFSEARFRQWLARKPWAFLDPYDDNRWHVSANESDAQRALQMRLADSSQFPLGAVVGLEDGCPWIEVRACADVYARIFWLVAWLLDSGPWSCFVDWNQEEKELRLDVLFRKALPSPKDIFVREKKLQPTVLLFDVDGTLIKSAGAGREALEAAFAAVVGAGPWLDFPLNGMTDLSIVRKALEQRSEVFSVALAQEIEEKYVSLLKDIIKDKEGYEVLPGVVDLLEEALSFSSKLVVGLGTGNVRRGAEIKLSRGQLNRYFSFGGFGSDHEDRTAMLEIGAKRGAEILGEDWEDCRIVVIGDTPLDVRAAHGCSADCIAVATGGHSIEALKEAQADWVFATLAEPGVREALLWGRQD